MWLYTACRGWVVPFQKPQGQLGVRACLSESSLLRQYRDQPCPLPHLWLDLRVVFS